MSTEAGSIMGWQQVASGLAAVWATDNTRGAIFDAMERKETYATTGSRMMVRFFGGWNFTLADMNSRQPAFTGYSKGVPMGGDLPAPGDGAKSSPSFMVYALRDPVGANLDRIQIVKSWQDGKKTMPRNNLKQVQPLVSPELVKISSPKIIPCPRVSRHLHCID